MPSTKIHIHRDFYTQDQLDKQFLYEDSPINYPQLIRSYLPDFTSSYFYGKLKTWVPCIEWIPKYRPRFILADLLAGFTVAIMNVPQAMAYGHLANLPPVIGLYTSFLPCLLYAFFGTCMHTSLGMFAIAALMVGNVVSSNTGSPCTTNMRNMTLSECPEVQLVVTLTFLVGLVMVAMAVLQIHVFASYLSDQLIRGFTTAAAIHVLLSQIPPLLGINGLGERSGFIKLYWTIYDIVTHISETNLAVLVLSAICVICLYIGKTYMNPQVKRYCSLPVPLELIAVIITTVLSHFLKFKSTYNMPVVNEIETGFPAPIAPDSSQMIKLLPSAAIIAIVIYVVSFSVGKLFGKDHKYKVNPSQELRAMALCQIVSSFFLCHPASVSLSRSKVVEQAGSKSQVSNIVSSLIILCVILWAGPLLEDLPMAVLSSIVVVALKGMIMQYEDLFDLWKCSKYDFIVWVFSFGITIIWDVSEGLIASFVFIVFTVVIRFQWSKNKVYGKLVNIEIYRNKKYYPTALTHENILVVNWKAPLLFFNSDQFKEDLLSLIGSDEQTLKYVILDASAIVSIDKMGTQILKETYEDLNTHKIQLLVSNTSDEFRKICSKCGLYKKLESKFFFPTVHDAVTFAEDQLKLEQIYWIESLTNNGYDTIKF